MAKDHGSSVKDDKQYEGLRKKGMSKQRAARIANSPSTAPPALEGRPRARSDGRTRERPRARSG